jgi:hypothetical protein
MEKSAAGARSFQSNAPKIQYFNGVFSVGWRLFLDSERVDLLNNFCNNTTNVYERTCIYPFDPKSVAWSEAKDTLGLTSTFDCNEKRILQ